MQCYTGVCTGVSLEPFCIVTEYVGGGSLRTLLDNAEVNITMCDMLRFASTACAGLCHLAAEGKFHALTVALRFSIIAVRYCA